MKKLLIALAFISINASAAMTINSSSGSCGAVSNHYDVISCHVNHAGACYHRDYSDLTPAGYAAKMGYSKIYKVATCTVGVRTYYLMEVAR